MMAEWITVITAVIASVTSYLIGRSKNKTDLAKAERDNSAQLDKEKQAHDSELEKFYALQMTTIIGEYKEQLSGLRSEIDKLKTEFSEFRKSHEKEVTEYKRYIEMLEEENDGLKIELEHVKEENSQLKEENAESKGGK